MDGASAKKPKNIWAWLEQEKVGGACARNGGRGLSRCGLYNKLKVGRACAKKLGVACVRKGGRGLCKERWVWLVQQTEGGWGLYDKLVGGACTKNKWVGLRTECVWGLYNKNVDVVCNIK